ncbi:ABC transporter substrate-binding protein [Ideonella sp. 4Y11]|uniref:ABC transporter substrate-binding protein n=1 Tax=Ideonella aquatica TaxID=2824119 RepID=A0A941BRF9_9BURK|nr:ABC transporter substrate-binding protein [Ideonella aquatica]MBQ0960345.1 ABC transporter substrate-binding protein [Ideonella aquatica]
MGVDDIGRRQGLARLLAGGWALATGRAAQAQLTPGVTPQAILVGQVLSMQAGRNEHGAATRQGVEAGVRRINAEGGILGRQLVIRVADDEAKSEQAEALAHQLVADGMFLLFGSIEGGPSNAVMKAAIAKNVPFFAPMAGSPTLRRPLQPLVFPVRAEHRDEFRALLAYGHSLGMRRAAFLQADTEVGRLHLANVQRACADLGMPPPLALPVGGEASDAQITAMVQSVREARCELIFNHGSIGVYERLIRALRQAGLGIACYGVNSGSAQLAKRLGELSHGMLFTQVVPSPWERKTALTREYQADFRAAFPDPEFSYGSLEGYLSVRALAEALRRSGRDLTRPGLVRALETASYEVAGFKLRYTREERIGSSFVDTALVTRDGRFRH